MPSPKYYQNTSPWSSFKSIKEVIGGIEYDVLENGVHYLITGSNTVSMVYVKLDENVSEYTVPSSVTSNGVTYTVTASPMAEDAEEPAAEETAAETPAAEETAAPDPSMEAGG